MVRCSYPSRRRLASPTWRCCWKANYGQLARQADAGGQCRPSQDRSPARGLRGPRRSFPGPGQQTGAARRHCNAGADVGAHASAFTAGWFGGRHRARQRPPARPVAAAGRASEPVQAGAVLPVVDSPGRRAVGREVELRAHPSRSGPKPLGTASRDHHRRR